MSDTVPCPTKLAGGIMSLALGTKGEGRFKNGWSLDKEAVRLASVTPCCHGGIVLGHQVNKAAGNR